MPHSYVDDEDDDYSVSDTDDDDAGRCGICDRGWLHGCCDDVCRGCYDALDCPSLRPCPCNPEMEIDP